MPFGIPAYAPLWSPFSGSKSALTCAPADGRTHIPIFDVDRIEQTRPDYLLILPWNLKDEIIKQTSCIREWGGKHIVPIPEAVVI